MTTVVFATLESAAFAEVTRQANGAGWTVFLSGRTSMTSVPRKAMADAELARYKYVAAIRLLLAAVPHNRVGG
nr:hypothetical protein CFP56_72630 [Quercus suber]